MTISWQTSAMAAAGIPTPTHRPLPTYSANFCVGVLFMSLQFAVCPERAIVEHHR